MNLQRTNAHISEADTFELNQEFTQIRYGSVTVQRWPSQKGVADRCGLDRHSLVMGIAGAFAVSPGPLCVQNPRSTDCVDNSVECLGAKRTKPVSMRVAEACL